MPDYHIYGISVPDEGETEFQTTHRDLCVLLDSFGIPVTDRGVSRNETTGKQEMYYVFKLTDQAREIIKNFTMRRPIPHSDIMQYLYANGRYRDDLKSLMPR